MEFIRGLHNIRARHRCCVATIGNFDGVHRGHASVIKQLRDAADRTGLPAVAILFEPQPMEFFLQEAAPPRLTPWRDKVEALCSLGVQRIVCLRFDQELAGWTAEQFVNRLLVELLAVHTLIVGDDFHFGKNRQGNFALLQHLASLKGFAVERTRTFMLEGERVSSSRIRELLVAGELRKVQQLLGRPYGMQGHVVHGQEKGRTMGFPTANLNLKRRNSPVRGILAARVRNIAEQPLPAVAYIGNRPIVHGTQDILEVHIFDYNGDCYRRRLHVELVEKLRDDYPFTSFDALKSQIAEDVARARSVLESEDAVLAEDVE